VGRGPLCGAGKNHSVPSVSTPSTSKRISFILFARFSESEVNNAFLGFWFLAFGSWLLVWAFGLGYGY
jgi:hypothetical protein